MKKLSVLVAGLICVSANIASAADYEFRTKVSRVTAYAMNSNYEANECIVYFETNSPSECNDKSRGVIKSDKEIGKLMCSFALTALVSEKRS